MRAKLIPTNKKPLQTGSLQRSKYSLSQAAAVIALLLQGRDTFMQP